MRQDIIITKYIDIFRECLTEELTLVEERSASAVYEILNVWTTRTLLYSFGDPTAMSKIVESIFTANEIRDFVYGLTMRFIVKISGNEDISFNKLISIVTSWCLTDESVNAFARATGSSVSQEQFLKELVLIPQEVPPYQRDMLLGISENIPALIDANRFLIVPIMMSIGGLVDAPTPSKG